MNHPLVSCITPTANRQKYLPSCIEYFLNQDYPNKELIILDDGRNSCVNLIPDDTRIKYYYSQDKLGTIGSKRNIAIGKASGEFIVQMDDDDYYARDWISRTVKHLIESKSELTGLECVQYYTAIYDKYYMFEDVGNEKIWVFGPTMVFRKSLWEKYNFRDLQVGEDHDFVWNCNGKVVPIDYFSGFCSILHAHNTSIKPIENPSNKKLGQIWVDEGADKISANDINFNSHNEKNG